MKAVIVATGENTAPEATGERLPGFLLPLIDRPFLQRIVEFLAEDSVVDSVDIILNHLPEKVEALLKDGARWGVRIRYHLVRVAARPYAAVSRLNTNSPVLLIHAESLPHIFLKQSYASPRPTAFCSAGTWTGWALLDSATSAGVQGLWDYQELAHFVMESARNRGSIVNCPIVLGVRSEAEFIVSQRAALDKRFPGLIFNGREVREGVWICRNVRLHPTATLVPPVYLGENSRVDAGVLLGPNVVVVRDSVLDRGTTVADSTIMPGSYVGQALELDHVIVDGNRLVSVRTGGDAMVRDDFILSGVPSSSFTSTFASLLSRAFALILFILTWPAVLLTALVLRLGRRGPVAYPIEALRLPAEHVWEWQKFSLNSFVAPESRLSALGHFFLRLLPGLIHVVRGQIHLVGVDPRSPDEVMALPADWRILYLRARAGLVTEAFVLHGAHPSPDEVYSCEAYYSVAAGPRHDAKVLLRYIGRMFQAQQAEAVLL